MLRMKIRFSLQTRKWKLIYGFSRGLHRAGLVRSGLFSLLASESGSTPLQYAVGRGDLEIDELLLEHGAETSLKNDLGKKVLSYVMEFVLFAR